MVILEKNGPVAILTLNRPERHNSLVPEFLQAILDALAAVEASTGASTALSTGVSVLILQANGRSFSTGGDALGFVEHADDIQAYARRIVGLLNKTILAMIDLRVPVVTAVHGIVTGGSLGFILGSDVVLVAPETSFAPFYSEVGPSPDGGWAVLLPLLIGQKRAAEVLYLNLGIDAETAVAWGLANRVIPGQKIHAAAQQIAASIVDKKQGSIQHTKRLLNLDRDEIARRLDAELEHFVAQISTEEGIGGFRDFLEELQRKKK